jgi:hypothetical protein
MQMHRHARQVSLSPSYQTLVLTHFSTAWQVDSPAISNANALEAALLNGDLRIIQAIVHSGLALGAEHNDWFALRRLVRRDASELLQLLVPTAAAAMAVSAGSTRPLLLEYAYMQNSTAVARYLVATLRLPVTLRCLAYAVDNESQELIDLAVIETDHSLPNLATTPFSLVTEAADRNLTQTVISLVSGIPHLQLSIDEMTRQDHLKPALVAAARRGNRELIRFLRTARRRRPLPPHIPQRAARPTVVDDTDAYVEALKHGQVGAARELLQGGQVSLTRADARWLEILEAAQSIDTFIYMISMNPRVPFAQALRELISGGHLRELEIVLSDWMFQRQILWDEMLAFALQENALDAAEMLVRAAWNVGAEVASRLIDWAIAERHVGLARALFEKGLVNVTVTLLTQFAESNAGAVSWLLDEFEACRGAVQSAKLVSKALDDRDEPLVVATAPHETRRTPLARLFAEACKFGLRRAVAALYRPYIDVNWSGGYALRFAAKNGDLAMVEFLCGLPGINVRKSKYVALRYAAQFNHPAVVEYLGTRPGVDITQLSDQLLSLAARKRRFGVIAALVRIPTFRPSPGAQARALEEAGNNGRLRETLEQLAGRG